MKIRFLYILFLLPWVAYAQDTKTIQFVDIKNNEPIQFARIVQGDERTTTNAEGKIEIEINNEDKVLAKALGFHELIINSSELVATDTIFMLHLTKLDGGNSTKYIIDPNFKKSEFILKREKSIYHYCLIKKTNQVNLKIKNTP